ncbi:MAG: S-methyl-5-thioribose-1-phosphate isomerase [bacterium]
MLQTLYWKNNCLYILDQLLLPGKVVYRTCATASQVGDCIRNMVIRGAPAIGVAAAYGLVLSVKGKKTTKTRRDSFARAKKLLSQTRPTAVNLFWALDKMERYFNEALSNGANLQDVLLYRAHEIFNDDVKANKAIGSHGARLLNKMSTVITHCNAGSLATAGWGTALGVIRSGFLRGRIAKVFVDETRPYLQGARLTAWELCMEHIPAELITDNMAGHMMKSESIDAVIVGADRVAANGDTANKIGTYSLAVLAEFHRIPFYVAAPASTFDLLLKSGDDIPIEERSARELTHIGEVCIAPKGIKVRHPAFDVTPAGLIAAIITEKGIIKKPNRKKVLRLLS